MSLPIIRDCRSEDILKILVLKIANQTLSRKCEVIISKARSKAQSILSLLRLRNGKNFLDLPAEIRRCILAHTVNFPNTKRHTFWLDWRNDDMWLIWLRKYDETNAQLSRLRLVHPQLRNDVLEVRRMWRRRLEVKWQATMVENGKLFHRLNTLLQNTADANEFKLLTLFDAFKEACKDATHFYTSLHPFQANLHVVSEQHRRWVQRDRRQSFSSYLSGRKRLSSIVV